MYRVLKILLIIAFCYLTVVASFESLLGYFQPESTETLIITTFDEDGNSSDRVVSRVEFSGSLFVAVNHWPRQWFHRLLETEHARIRFGEVDRMYRAELLGEADASEVDAAHPLGFGFRVLTGFPPRYIVKLIPLDES